MQFGKSWIVRGWNDVQGLSTAIAELNGTITELNIDSKRERERFCKVIHELRI